MVEFDLKLLEASYASIPGGTELMEYFGEVPSFHDAEIVGLELHRRGISNLKVHGWVADQSDPSNWSMTKHALVTFHIAGITDLELDGFSTQNVIGRLMIARTASDPERERFYSLEDRKEQDFELVLEPCYGMDGRIRCKSISISYEEKIPTDISD